VLQRRKVEAAGTIENYNAFARQVGEAKAAADLGLHSLLRDYLADIRQIEILTHWAAAPPRDDALVKCVTLFKPDLLHMNMRLKSHVLRRSIYSGLLKRDDLSRDARKLRVAEVEVVLNNLVNSREEAEGSIGYVILLIASVNYRLLILLGTGLNS
jgi:hypothetical protein